MFLNLNNGFRMPVIGLGTWMAPDDEIMKALNLALELNYRSIDAAPVYQNEKAIGTVLRSWLDSGKLKREDLFICSKLPEFGHRSVLKYLKKTLSDLQIDYLDMYLVHTPFAILDQGDPSQLDTIEVDMETNIIDVWKTMEQMVSKGLTKSIGISNFNQEQIQRILSVATIKPANLQIEMHIYLQQHDLLNFCKANNIVVTAYSPLGSKGLANLLPGSNIPNLLENPEVVKIASRLNKTPAQILLRWLVQRGVAVIPKSTNTVRLRENLEIFDFMLTNNDMSVIRGLDREIRICDFSFMSRVKQHPEFPWKK